MWLLEATSVGVEYGQIYVMDGTTTWSGPIGTIGGQRNGLCGPRWPGALVLITGLHTGQVLFTVNVTTVRAVRASAVSLRARSQSRGAHVSVRRIRSSARRFLRT